MLIPYFSSTSICSSIIFLVQFCTLPNTILASVTCYIMRPWMMRYPRLCNINKIIFLGDDTIKYGLLNMLQLTLYFILRYLFHRPIWINVWSFLFHNLPKKYHEIIENERAENFSKTICEKYNDVRLCFLPRVHFALYSTHVWSLFRMFFFLTSSFHH